MKVDTQEVSIGEFTFTVDVSGSPDGERVLLLHGFPETRHMWREQLRALAGSGCRAIAPDQRGYSAGARPASVDAYAAEFIVKDALLLADAYGAPRFHLVGHDWGGQIAWLIAAGQPSRVRSLTILSRPHPAAFARAMREDTEQSGRSSHHRAFRESNAVERMREAKLQPLRAALESQGVPSTDAEVYLQTLSQAGAIEGAMNWYRASNIATAEIPSIDVPTLYIWGTDDATVGRRAAELTSAYVSGPCRFVTLEGAGHFLVDQFPQQVSALLLEHIQAYAGE